jgi:hypothetical protein
MGESNMNQIEIQTKAAGLGSVAANLAVSPNATATATSGTDDRAYWCSIAAKLATPVLAALAERRLKATMPVESQPSSKDRRDYTHLEALARLLSGIASWLELGGDETSEGRERARFAALARAAIDSGTDPASPDFLNFSKGEQPLVDAGFLAQAVLRAPNELWKKLEPRVQKNLVAALKSSRPISPGESNWQLFASTIEVFLHTVGEKRDDARLFEALRRHRDWYVGDGMYGDGSEFHWDYYNAFVIQPMLLENLDVVGDEAAEWKTFGQKVREHLAHFASIEEELRTLKRVIRQKLFENRDVVGDEAGKWKTFREKVRERLTRFAAIEERLIAPDGSYPIIGRSIAYRCGAMHGLALAARRKMLPNEVSPAQARVALTRVIRRTLEAPETFDANGWLRIGVAGHQPGLGEFYISTGSLYLCSLVLLALGLPASDPFWSDPPAKTTWEKVWSGENVLADHALQSPK